MKTSGWLEEIQDYIDSSTDIVYTTTTSLFISQTFIYDKILTAPSLTLYEESGDITFGRITKQGRNIRFVFRDSSTSVVLDRAHSFFEWILDNRVIETTNFKTQSYRVFRPPAFVDVVSDIYIADCVIGFTVTAN